LSKMENCDQALKLEVNNLYSLSTGKVYNYRKTHACPGKHA